MKAGWPIDEEPGVDFGSPTIGPDGSAYVEACAGTKAGCVVHRFDHTGREVSGWPAAMPNEFACSAQAAACRTRWTSDPTAPCSCPTGGKAGA